MSIKKPNGMTGKQNAKKPEAERVSGKGRLIADIGPLKPRLIKAARRGKIKKILVEILEEGLQKRGF